VKFRDQQPEEPDIVLTPLIDVVFLLLIFFMVSTTFNRESEISIELPEAEGEQAETRPEIIDITIDAQGRFYVNQQEVVNTKVTTLVQAIKKVAGDREDPPIIISADAKTPHQSVVTAMDAARRLGFLHLTFATTQNREE
jgi:biopolymer transport protein ExbD